MLPRFGLIDSSPTRWENLKERIAELNNAGASSSTTYRVLFVGRHGEGYREFFLVVDRLLQLRHPFAVKIIAQWVYMGMRFVDK